MRCRRLASGLARRGIGRLDTVAILAPNIPEMIEAHFAVPMLGAVLNPLNTRLDAATIAFILRHGEAKVADRRPGLRAAGRAGAGAAATSRRSWSTSPTPAPRRPIGAIDYEAFSPRAIRTSHGRGPEDEWQSLCLLYTSGTTGNPKGAVYSHRGAYLQALGNALTFGLTPRQRLSLDAADVPLQRLDLYLGDDGGRRHACLPAQGRAGARSSPHRRARRDASLRRADRAHRCWSTRRTTEAAASRRRCAAPPAARRRPRRSSRRWRRWASR